MTYRAIADQSEDGFYADAHGIRWYGLTVQQVFDEIDKYEEAHDKRAVSYIVNPMTEEDWVSFLTLTEDAA